MESVWNQVKTNMKTLLPDHSFRMWIQPIQFIGSELLSSGSGVVILACPNSFSQKRIKDNYLAGMIQDFLKMGQELGLKNVKIELNITDNHKAENQKTDVQTGKKRGAASISIAEADAKKGFAAISMIEPLSSVARLRMTPATNKTIPSTNRNGHENQKRSSAPDQLPLPGLTRIFDTGRMLKKDYTFDQFVVGNNNDFAYSASLSLAQGGNNANGALYLLAGTGLGKSHLSQAVGHHVINQGITNKVFYITSEDFTNEMVHSIQNHTISNFKEKYRKKCDMLILEDIHFLSGKEATQKELAMTLDYLLDAEKKIIFSGCYLPDDIPKMNDQLKSRLTMGLVTKMEAPDFETRVKIIKKKIAD